jgi:hypothetical protein
MNTNSENGSLLKQPSAWIPLLMSFVALAMIVVHVALFGVTHSEDEGLAAHLFQLIMIAQLPVAGYFAIRWLPKQPKQALSVLALQVVAWIIPIATIIWLESPIG